MTEPNEPATPLSRMRFSWQRGAPTADDRRPDGASTTVDSADSTSAAPSAPASPPAPAPAPAQPPVPDIPERWSPPYEHHAPPAPAPPAHPPMPGEVPGEMPGEMPGGEPPVEPPPPVPAVPATRLGRATADDLPPPAEYDEPLDLDAMSRPGAGRFRSTDRADTGSRTDAARTAGRRGARNDEPRKTSRTDRTFEVPPPGGRFRGGRGGHAAVRVALILTTCLLVLGLVGYSAFVFGVSAMRSDTYKLSQDDIDRYRLTEFPLEQAGRFAADYARLCLSRSDLPEAQSERQAQLAGYVADGVDPACGWSGEAVQQVVDSSWTGGSEPIEVEGYSGHARMMSVRVLTVVDGLTSSRVLSVPVYVQNLATGEGMRIIGDIGEMPQPLLASPPEAQPVGPVDQTLTDALLDGQFFQQFFEAWGKSDAPSLGRFVTADATERATAGLTDTLTEPVVTKAQVFLPEGATPGEFRWSKGDTAEAWVWVTWKNPALGPEVTQTRAYRLQLRMDDGANPAQSWAVRDVRGGVPKVGP